MPPPLPATVPLLSRAAQSLRAGRVEEAIPLLAEAARLRPADAAILHDFGLACLEAGRLPHAIDALQRAVAARPDYADAHFRLGIALEKAGDAAAAVRAYDRATELLPSLTEAWYRAGALVYTMGHKEEARGCFARAATTGPRNPFGRLGAARALLIEERDADAERALRRLLALEPRNAIALDLLGNVLAEAGRFDEARGYFLRAIAQAPLMAGAYYELVRCRPVTEADADIVPAMQGALSTPGLEPAQRMRVHLALGKAHEDLGQYGHAMAHFDAADALRGAACPFDAAAFDAQIEAMIAHFTPDLIARAQGGCDATPILIVGMPRSGTTLLEQIISAHPDVSGGGELNFWNERGIDWHRAGGAQDVIARAAADYLALLRRIGPTAARVTDKMPFNFLWAGLIHLALPRATIIHIRRPAIDTALSIHQTYFNPRLAFPTGGAPLAAYFRAYQRLTAHWRRVLPANRFIEVDYDDLTGAPEPAIARLLAACGLGWNAACVSPQDNARAVRTPSKWQARQPITRHGVERWRRYEPCLGQLRVLLEDQMCTEV